KHTRGSSTLPVYLLDPEIEALLEKHQRQGTELPEAESHQVLATIAEEMSRQLPTAQSPALLTTIEVRSALRQLIQTRFPHLPVLCYQELSPDSNIQPLARIAL